MNMPLFRINPGQYNDYLAYVEAENIHEAIEIYNEYAKSCDGAWATRTHLDNFGHPAGIRAPARSVEQVAERVLRTPLKPGCGSPMYRGERDRFYDLEELKGYHPFDPQI
jgi:hypothetical protein